MADLVIYVHPHVTRRRWRWYPWLQIRSRHVETPKSTGVRSIVLTPHWRRASAEKAAAYATRIYANVGGYPKTEVVTFGVTPTAKIFYEAQEPQW